MSQIILCSRRCDDPSYCSSRLDGYVGDCNHDRDGQVGNHEEFTACLLMMMAQAAKMISLIRLDGSVARAREKGETGCFEARQRGQCDAVGVWTDESHGPQEVGDWCASSELHPPKSPRLQDSRTQDPRLS